MATTTNRPVSSHTPGSEPRKVKIMDQGPEAKSAVKNPNRADAADRSEFDAQVEAGKDFPRSEIPTGSPTNIPVDEGRAGITDPPAGNPSEGRFETLVVDDVATGDPDSIAAWKRRHEEEERLRKRNEGN